mmetsp:Transcript_29096/g.55993  ORF Transcript_29096/g.55993 Transcript_29096/m.55993 type:complete len:224 (+) Transcript_29096:6270-6941(+)
MCPLIKEQHLGQFFGTDPRLLALEHIHVSLQRLFVGCLKIVQRRSRMCAQKFFNFFQRLPGSRALPINPRAWPAPLNCALFEFRLMRRRQEDLDMGAQLIMQLLRNLELHRQLFAPWKAPDIYVGMFKGGAQFCHLMAGELQLLHTVVQPAPHVVPLFLTTCPLAQVGRSHGFQSGRCHRILIWISYADMRLQQRQRSFAECVESIGTLAHHSKLRVLPVRPG